MKSRPRGIERRAATLWSEACKPWGSEVLRIPVLGRTGPDIEINELMVAIDVKSRKETPKLALPAKGESIKTPDYMVARVENLPEILDGTWKPKRTSLIRSSVIVAGWLDHMQDWVDKHPDQAETAALIVGKTGMPVGTYGFVITPDNLRRLHERLNSLPASYE